MTRIPPAEVGHRLEEFIRSKGWTKKEFARRVDINPANVSKYIRGALDVQHIVVQLIANGCDVKQLFFNEGKKGGGDGKSGVSPAIQELLQTSDEIAAAPVSNKGARLRWLQVSKRNGLGLYPVLASGDRVLLSSEAEIKDGDLVAVNTGKDEQILKIAHFDRDQVILRSVNPLVKPLAVPKMKASLSKVVLIKKR